MSKDWVKDIAAMQEKYGVHDWIETATHEQKMEFLKFRIAFLHEELEETETASKSLDAEEIVDGLIDLCVVAIGTLDAFGVDSHTAWDEVLHANLKKEVGVKESRPNPLGLPDLIKPKDWTGPSHANNHGLFSKM